MLENITDWLETKWRNLTLSPPKGKVLLGDFERAFAIDDDRGKRRGQTIDNFYVERFLKKNQAHIGGRVLEVGGGDYARYYAHLSGAESCSITALETLTIADPIHLNPLPCGAFDCLVLPQCLQVNFELDASIRTVHRILKPGGIVLATFPGINRATESALDEEHYWGLTSMSAKRLFGDVFGANEVEIEAYGNVLSAMSFLHGLSANELNQQELDHADSEYQVIVAVKARKS